MPPLWFASADGGVSLKDCIPKVSQILEVEAHGDSLNPQGHFLGQVDDVNHQDDQYWVNLNVFAVEHWFFSPKGYQNPGWYHLCQVPLSRCKERRPNGDGGEKTLHAARWRTVSIDDLRDKKVGWAAKGTAKIKVEHFLAAQTSEAPPQQHVDGQGSQSARLIEGAGDPAPRDGRLRQDPRDLARDLDEGAGEAAVSADRRRAKRGREGERKEGRAEGKARKAKPFESALARLRPAADAAAGAGGAGPSKGTPPERAEASRSKGRGRKKKKKKKKKKQEPQAKASFYEPFLREQFQFKRIRPLAHARDHPGYLAARALQKMEAQVTKDGGATSDDDPARTPAVAQAYYLRVLKTTYPNIPLRTARELKTLCVLADRLAARRPAQAADIALQRIMACEKSLSEGGPWDRAQFCELVEPDGATLMDQDLECIATKEADLQRRQSLLALPPCPAASLEPAAEACPADLASALPDVAAQLSDWQAAFAADLRERRSTGVGLTRLRGRLLALPSAFGRFHRESKLAAGRFLSDTPSSSVSRDLFPIPLGAALARALRGCVAPAPHERQGAESVVVELMASGLNFIALAGWEARPIPADFGNELTKGQEAVVRHHHRSAQQFLEWGTGEVSFEAAMDELMHCRVDYSGAVVSKRRQLTAEEVLVAWPAPGKAAIAPVVAVLQGELLEDVLNPFRCLRPREEWPDEPPRSRVHVSDSEWYLICREALDRGIFVECPESEIFRDQGSGMVLNGAMGVDKYKGNGPGAQHLLRFISILCPANAYLRRPRGASDAPPYFGQMTHVDLAEDEYLIDDGQDQEGCFNIFYLPPAWRGFFCFEKRVPRSVMGGDPNSMMYVSIATVPMGWAGAVDLMQVVIRKLVFEEAEISPSTEFRKDLPLPQGPAHSLACLDGFDFLQKVNRQACEARELDESLEAKRFARVRERWDIPLNEGKRLTQCLRAGALGGAFLGDRDWLSLQGEKMHKTTQKGLAFAALLSWTAGALGHFVGAACFAGQFWRPLFSILQEVFFEFRALEGGRKAPDLEAFDEVLLFTILLPLAYSNLRAPMRRRLSCADASEEGGAACEASALLEAMDPRRSHMVESHYAGLAEESAWPVLGRGACGNCQGPLSGGSAEQAPCPALCGVVLCSVECVVAHRRGPGCRRGDLRLPAFAECCSGSHGKLAWAVARAGAEISAPLGGQLRPFADAQALGHGNFICDECNHESVAWEHWAPEAWSFRRAPQPVRDHRHLWGPRGLEGQVKKQVDAFNKMAMLALRRVEWRLKNYGFGVLAHPVDSWLRELPLSRRLFRYPGVCFTVLWPHGRGGSRAEGMALLHNSPALHSALHRPAMEHEAVRPSIGAGTFMDLAHPEGMCRVYAEVMLKELKEFEATRPLAAPSERAVWIRCELSLATQRLSQGSARLLAVQRILAMTATMEPGREAKHLASLLQLVDYRGADVRLDTGYSTEGRQGLPHPAFCWRWETTRAYKWVAPQHINVLEFVAVLNYF
ncbi:unnamed protein product, partial [Prorocentrum cordatum]